MGSVMADTAGESAAELAARLYDVPVELVETQPMRQEAPYPYELVRLVDQLRLPTRPGWRVYLADLDRGQGSKGLTLIIHVVAPDSYHPERMIHVNHYMIVPAAGYDMRSWRRWLFEQLRLVDLHELAEGFVIEEDHGNWTEPTRPYAPSHGPGNDPYLVREVGTEVDVRTSFRGELND